MVIVFLKKAMKFSSIITVLVIVILLINSIVVSISFKEQLNKPNYFIGDSTFEQGIFPTDSIKNLSKSGNSLLYTYLKIKQITEHTSPQKIFISVGSHNVFSDIDNRWLLSEGNFQSRVSVFYPFMRKEEFLFFLKNDNTSLLSSSSSVLKNCIKYGAYYAINKKIDFGGYKNKNANNLIEAKQELNKKTNKNYIEYSKIELFYLEEIINLCKNKNIELFVVNTPKHKDYLEFYSKIEFYLNSIFKQKFPKVNYLDLSKLFDNNNYFQDLMHLNIKGSQQLTNYITLNFIEQ
jgi:hypothetical protein